MCTVSFTIKKSNKVKIYRKRAKNCKDKNTPFNEVQEYYESECLGWVNGVPVEPTTVAVTMPPVVADPDPLFVCDPTTQRSVFLVSQHHKYSPIVSPTIAEDVEMSEHECLDMCRQRDVSCNLRSTRRDNAYMLAASNWRDDAMLHGFVS